MQILFITVAWTIVIAFIVTVAVTILGVTNVLKFSDRKYLDRLFTTVILEVIAVGFLIFQTGFSDVSVYFTSVATLFEDANKHHVSAK